MTSLIEIEATMLQRFGSLAFGKNKVSDKSTMARAMVETPTNLPSQGHLLNQMAPVASQHFEVIFVTFLKISYYLGIAPYYTKVVKIQGEKIVESSYSRFHMV